MVMVADCLPIENVPAMVRTIPALDADLRFRSSGDSFRMDLDLYKALLWVEPGTGARVVILDPRMSRIEAYRHAVAAEEPALVADATSNLAEQLQLIRVGFDGSISRLCEVFGVSRQTTHSWFTGLKVPRERHLSRIAALAKAAAVFQRAQFAVSSTLLDRPLLKERSFLELVADGADGEITARRLMQVAHMDSRARDALFSEYVPRSLRKA